MKPITIVISSTIHHNLMKFSIEKTLENTPHVEDIIVFADRPVLNYGTFIPIKKNFSYADYNFLMLKQLSPFVKTDFILHIHPDGMATNKHLWNDDYLNYDYVGAPWLSGKVGNGGFSLRSYRLIEALQSNEIRMHWVDDEKQYINEDSLICRYYREYLEVFHKINFAPPELAHIFSKEMNANGQETFGFHGTWIFPKIFERELVERLMDGYYDSNPLKKNTWDKFVNNVYTIGYEQAFEKLLNNEQ
jgi:hypothetical protein